MTQRASTSAAHAEDRSADALVLLEQVLDRPSDERRDFIEHAAGDDTTLRATTLALLDAHAASQGFLDPPQAAGRTLDPYRLIAPIGAGGMGQVWLAERRDGAYQQRVAIKVLASLLGDPETLRRAEAERQFLAWLDHPNIARVLDGGTTPEGQPYVVMEYVDGQRIDTWCREAHLDPTARVRIFLQVLDAIDAAHRALIIHRDIKPANVLVTEEGIVKLLDFGIAKSLDGRIGGSATQTGFAPMTPEYASPEQLTGKPLTTASDVYALGLLLYELLCGSVANIAHERTIAELAQQIALHAPTRPSQRIDAAALEIEPRTAAEWRRRLNDRSRHSQPQIALVEVRTTEDPASRWLGCAARYCCLWMHHGTHASVCLAGSGCTVADSNCAIQTRSASCCRMLGEWRAGPASIASAVSRSRASLAVKLVVFERREPEGKRPVGASWTLARQVARSSLAPTNRKSSKRNRTARGGKGTSAITSYRIARADLQLQCPSLPKNCLAGC